MALKQTTITRQFKYNGITLSDLAPGKTPDQIRLVYASQYPELLNSVIEGPVTKAGVSTYTFARAAGSKGQGHVAAMRCIAAGAARKGKNDPIQSWPIEAIKEAQKCSTTVHTVVSNRQKSTPLRAPAAAYSRFG
jgi:PRTRC genetic system protein C